MGIWIWILMWSIGIKTEFLNSLCQKSIEYLSFIPCTRVRHPQKEYPGYDINLDLMVKLQYWSQWNVEYPFIGITPLSTLTWSSCIC